MSCCRGGQSIDWCGGIIQVIENGCHLIPADNHCCEVLEVWNSFQNRCLCNRVRQTTDVSEHLTKARNVLLQRNQNEYKINMQIPLWTAYANGLQEKNKRLLLVVLFTATKLAYLITIRICWCKMNFIGLNQAPLIRNLINKRNSNLAQYPSTQYCLCRGNLIWAAVNAEDATCLQRICGEGRGHEDAGLKGTMQGRRKWKIQDVC